MEILILIAIFFGFGFIMRLIGLAGRATVAAGKSAVTGETFSESFRGIPDFNLRLENVQLGEGDKKFPAKSIQLKGLLPVPYPMDLLITGSVLDVTDNIDKPVLCFFDNGQEPDSTIFRLNSNVGVVSTSAGYTDWVDIGVIIPDTLDPPYGGKRKLELFLFFVDKNKYPDAQNVSNHKLNSAKAIVNVKTKTFEYDFKIKGYEEEQEHREEAAALSVKIAMAVAMSDGSLDDAEGNKIKDWIKKNISFYGDQKKKELKDLYNNAMKEAYQLAKKDDLILSKLTKRLNEIGDKKSKYDTVELCYEVMGADGVADPEEIKTINNISKSLNLDANELEKMRDKQMMNISSDISVSSLEETLGIDPTWSKEKIKTFLINEFQKWNGRINSVSDENERKNIQSRLDDIAKLRKKYE